MISTLISYGILGAYAGLTIFFESHKNLDHLWFTLTVYLLTDFGPRCAPKSLTFSESFTLSFITTFYGAYAVKQIVRPVLTSVGNPILNSALFLPWLSVGIFLCILYLLNSLLRRPAIAFALSLLPTMALLVAFCLHYPTVIDRLMVILLHPENISMIFYLAVTLILGLLILFDLTNEYDDQMLKLG